MEANQVKVLLIEDKAQDAQLIIELLNDAAQVRPDTTIDLEHSNTLNAGLQHLIGHRPDVILIDPSLVDHQEIETITRVRSVAPNVPIITLTDVEDEILAVEAMQKGSQDYLVKGKINANSLMRAIRYSIERQRMFAELAQKAAELEGRNAELDEFAHTVAHQVQGLLSQMVGYTSYITMNYSDDLNEELNRLLKKILQSGHKMNNVISELLLLASVRKGEILHVPLNMSRIITEARKRLMFEIEKYEGDISQQEEWPVAMGYPSWVEEVWVNYISNALKYGGPSPKISLGAEYLPDEMIRFWVNDKGPGIDLVDQKRLFTAHTRLQPTRATGEGLGLSIVQRIVVKSGGLVGVDSEPGEGSTFWFTLPAANDQEELPEHFNE